jgi:2-C-methyl-D-erythritol 4-phosphate cytidylyltransferase
MSHIKAVLLLGGEGQRMQQTPLKEKCPKQFLPLGEKKVYEWTLDTFQKSGLFSEIILVCPKDHLIENGIIGGKTRQESSYKGILACGDETDFVVIHDAVRPFVSLDILKRNVEALKIHNAVNTCIPTHDTINYVENHSVISIPKRTACMRGQTPQSFSYKLIKEAHEKTSQTNAPDDCSLVLELGHEVHVVFGSEENFKITTQNDYHLALSFLTNSI